MIGNTESEDRGVAEPERQASQEAYLCDVDRVQAPGRIDAITHGPAGEHARADTMSDRIPGKRRERVDEVENIRGANRAQREPIIKCQREVASRHEQRGQRDLAGFGLLDRIEDFVEIDAAQHMVEYVARDPNDRDADNDT